MPPLVIHVGIKVANIGEKIHNMRLRVMFFFLSTMCVTFKESSQFTIYVEVTMVKSKLRSLRSARVSPCFQCSFSFD